VLLLDVLEHLPDPAEMLRSLTLAFPELATVLVTLPARSELWSNFDEYYGHYRRYDTAMATHLLRSAGLTVVESSYFFHSLYWPMRLSVGLGSRRSLEMSAPKPRARLLHHALARVLEWDARLVPAGWSGTSVLAVARRAR
jgi:hypothetical protein